MCLTFLHSGSFSLLLVAFERIFDGRGNKQIHRTTTSQIPLMSQQSGTWAPRRVPPVISSASLVWLNGAPKPLLKLLNPFSLLPRRDSLLLLDNCVCRNTDSECGSLTLVSLYLCVSLLLVSFYSSQRTSSLPMNPRCLKSKEATDDMEDNKGLMKERIYSFCFGSLLSSPIKSQKIMDITLLLLLLHTVADPSWLAGSFCHCGRYSRGLVRLHF